MTGYEKLKQVIQQANPEIMELKFGCEVLFKEEKGIYIHGFVNEHWVQFLNYKFPPQIINKIFEHNLKILGRPIRLADVLLAIENWALKLANGDTVFENEAKRLVWDWILTDDNLDHQSDETKQFLIDLLT